MKGKMMRHTTREHLEVEAEREQQRNQQRNATFHAFKPSGKWYTSERGTLTQACYGEAFTPAERRARVVKANGGHYPGLNSAGDRFVLVVVPDESVDFGFPLLLLPIVAWEK